MKAYLPAWHIILSLCKAGWDIQWSLVAMPLKAFSCILPCWKMELTFIFWDLTCSFSEFEYDVKESLELTSTLIFAGSELKARERTGWSLWTTNLSEPERFHFIGHYRRNDLSLGHLSLLMASQTRILTIRAPIFLYYAVHLLLKNGEIPKHISVRLICFLVSVLLKPRLLALFTKPNKIAFLA